MCFFYGRVRVPVWACVCVRVCVCACVWLTTRGGVVLVAGAVRCTSDFITSCLDGIARGHDHYAGGLSLATKVLTNVFSHRNEDGEDSAAISAMWNDIALQTVPVRSTYLLQP